MGNPTLMDSHLVDQLAENLRDLAEAGGMTREQACARLGYPGKKGFETVQRRLERNGVDVPWDRFSDPETDCRSIW